MKKQNYILLLLLLCLINIQFAFGQYPNLIENIQFEDNIDGTWTLGLNSGSEATLASIVEPNWQNVDMPRGKVSVSIANGMESVYITSDNKFVLHAGDICTVRYYCKSTVAGSVLKSVLHRIDSPEGEETSIDISEMDLKTSWKNEQLNVTIQESGTYELRLNTGATVADYTYNNISLKVKDYEAVGAPKINSFSIAIEQQGGEGEQGVNQIIGRVDAYDAEGDDFTYEYNLIYGKGSITPIDETSFIYNKDGFGVVYIKVTVKDVHGNIRSKIQEYIVQGFEISELYFNEDVWDLVMEINGYSNHASFDFPENNPELPNVLLMGNSVSIGYTPFVREQLEGVANVYRIPDNGGSTLDMFENQELWLGDTHWDVIHFNWGLHDLKYLLNNNLNLNGTQVVPVDEYAVNMDSIVKILQPTADNLIFATTSYVPSGAGGRKRGDEVTYNTAALSVMANYPEILIDDQFTTTLNNLSEQNTNDVHFNLAGRERQGIQAAEKIKEALASLSTKSITSDASNNFYYVKTKEALLVKTKTEIAELLIYNINGSVVKTIKSPNNQISLSGLPQGIFIIVATSVEGDAITQKILKN
ncbi:hypothetical protein BTO15_05075 [Polaribacter sejongensis]|uniref:Secretion system C-terminal sorting domain-containing protein n=1 Tax=Polaribacter sejongensis TaxID=985043 RepID=A0ABN5F2G5_9FLAO|nr:T9SS type A sorting domain-containing protein [Polaribacter sejongensis]AUC21512.1 hypothetical protein BTO15_05075 [Polaribacter sejongensis]